MHRPTLAPTDARANRRSHQTNIKLDLQRHQANRHGVGDLEKAAERRKRERERLARLPVKRCDVDGCAYQTRLGHNLRQHKTAVHGVGGVEAVEEKRRKDRERRARLAAEVNKVKQH